MIPNLLSIFRMVLVMPAVWLLMREDYLAALILIAAAVLTDGLDGFLAKTFNWRTRIGGILDPLADKLLFISVFVTLGVMNVIPVWLVVLVLTRDAVIISGGLACHFLFGPFEMEPTLISKLNTLAQFLFTLSVLVAQVAGVPGPTIIQLLQYALVVTTLGSGLNYVFIWGRRAWYAARESGTGT